MRDRREATKVAMSDFSSGSEGREDSMEYDGSDGLIEKGGD